MNFQPAVRLRLMLLFGFIVCIGFSCRRSEEIRESVEQQASKDEETFSGLATARQKLLWQYEHITFELETKFGQAFTKAWESRKSAELRRFMRDDLHALLVPGKQHRVLNSTWWNHEDWQRTNDRDLERGDAEDLVSRLLAWAGRFQRIDRTRLRVLQIQPVANAVSGNWDLLLQLTAAGVDVDGKPLSFLTTHRVLCKFESDNEIATGCILASWKDESLFIEQASQRLLEEQSAEWGLLDLKLRDNWTTPRNQNQTYAMQVAVEDFDRDGDLDIAFSTFHGPQRLLQCQDNKFVDVTRELALPAQRTVREQVALATWLDFDNDGYPDLLLGSRLYQNLKGEGFQDVTERSGLSFDYPVMGCVVADYDCDGKLDLYVLNHSDATKGQQPGYLDDEVTEAPNQLWRNQGNGRFMDVTRLVGNLDTGNRQSFTAVWFHADRDRFPDLYVVNDFGKNFLFLSDGKGGLRDATDVAGVGSFANSMGAATGDIDGDGRAEIYVANMFSKMGRRIIAHVSEADYPAGVYEQIQGACAGNLLYAPTGIDGEFREISQDLRVNQVGWAHGPVLADFDADGFLDIYATTGFQSFDRGKPDG